MLELAIWMYHIGNPDPVVRVITDVVTSLVILWGVVNHYAKKESDKEFMDVYNEMRNWKAVAHYNAEQAQELRERLNEKWEDAGDFLCTAYCTEKREHICGTGTGITASGAPVEGGVTVAADPDIFPFGTVLYIEDVGVRIVQDTGASVKGKHLDVAVSGSHKDALNWDGYGQHRVWIIREAE